MKKLLLFFAVLGSVLMFSCKEAEPDGDVLRVNPTTLKFPQRADSKTIDFYAKTEWSAEITEGSEWVSLDTTNGLSYEGILVVSVTANPDEGQRQGEITFTMGAEKEVLTIEQSGTGMPGVVMPEAIMRPDVLTPINYTPDYIDGGMDGVTIEITEKTTNNFKFTMTPGANIQSYRLDVYPLCRLYNSLYESMNNAHMDMTQALPDDMVEEMIRGFIFDTSGAGAYTFSVDNMEDFLRHEFDWMNTEYAQAKIVPDCEYVIAAVGCFDKDGYEQGDLSLCYVRTPYYPLQGDPRVEMEVLTSFNAMQIDYIPNKDAKYFYEWCSDESDLQPYIDTYGEKLYIDFMRNAVYDPRSCSDADALFFYRNFGSAASPEVPIMATTVGLDANYTPATTMEREIFTLRERPAETTPAEATITIDEEHVGATVFWLNVEMAANCNAAVMRVYTKEQAEEVKKMSEAELAVLAREIYENGWGFGNKNYGYNLDTDELTGSSYRMSEPWVSCESDTEYVIAYTAMNQYKEVAPLKFTDVVKTKPIVKDTPEVSEENAVLELTANGTQEVTVKFTYDFDKVAKIHFQFVEGYEYETWVPTPTNEATREDFINFLFEEGDNQGPTNAQNIPVNHWWSEPHGVDSYTLINDPNTTYTVAYVAEDWNGVLGEVKFGSATTDPLIGGDDPQMSITGDYTADGQPFFTFAMVKDAMQMYTAVCDGNSMKELYDLGNRNKLRYKDAVTLFENFIMSYGISRYATTATELADGLCVAIGMAIGGEAGAPIYGPMEHLIYANEEFRTLVYYYPNDVPASVQGAIRAARQQVITAHERSVGYVHSSELPEVECGVRTQSIAEFAESRNMTLVDYGKLSSHPKATGR